jgi:hypothetical protein
VEQGTCDSTIKAGFGAAPPQSTARNVAAFARRLPGEIVDSPGLGRQAPAVLAATIFNMIENRSNA